MPRNKLDEQEYRKIADELDISVDDVRNCVHSFFGVLLGDVRKLPFNDERKIFSKDKFSGYAVVRNIPYIGRLGPVYSRYLKWRANEAGGVPRALRSSYRSRYLQSDIENMAAEILSGKTPSKISRKKYSDMYKRVWLVGQDGKKSARQVIPKETE